MLNRFLRAIFVLCTIVALIFGSATTLFARWVSQPMNANDDKVTEFEVPEGSSVTDIANLLKTDGLISQPLLFRLLAREQNVDSLKAGTYRLRKNMKMSQIIALLAEKRTGAGGKEIEFDIIPGQRLEQIAQTMADKGVVRNPDEFLAVARNPKAFKDKHPRLQSIPDGQSLEGYLFPDKYRVFESTPIADVIDRILTDGFDKNYEQVEKDISARMPDNQPPNVHQIVTMASIIQREAYHNQDMAHISYVFWRRLHPDTPEVYGRLQSDPTLQYVVGKPDNWWPDINKTLTPEQINNNESPYNTRKAAGLPPGPISAPTLDALRAAAQPNVNRPDNSNGSNDLYFISGCDHNEIKFAKSLAEFGPMIDEFQKCAAKQSS